jgi:hypothetical protein
MSKKKKHIKKGWLCPECQTVYAPSVKQCDCVKEAAAVVTVTEGDDGELHLDWDKPLGLKIGWGKAEATITGIASSGSTEWVKGLSWYKMPPRNPNDPIYIYDVVGVGSGL